MKNLIKSTKKNSRGLCKLRKFYKKLNFWSLSSLIKDYWVQTLRRKLQEIIDKYHHLSEEMTKPEVLSDQKKLSSVAKEHSSLEKVVQVATEYISVLDQIDEDTFSNGLNIAFK